MKTPNNILTITKKELKSYFDSPTAYIVLVVFLLLWEYLFFKQSLLRPIASLRDLFQVLPWLFLILIPAITMGSVSQEKNEGTLELLLTHPVRETEFLIGKFLGAFIFVLSALAFAIPIGISFTFFGQMDWGIIASQLLGGALMAAVFLAIGIFISSLFSSQITALLVSAAVGFLLVILQTGFVTQSLPHAFVTVLEQLSVVSHFDSMARGVIDLRDILYFVSMTAVFLGLAYLQLIKRKFGNRKELYRSWQIAVYLLIAITVLVNIIGDRIPGRIDLTQNRIYTLSPATKDVLDGLNDVVRINLYASNELPVEFAPTQRDATDLLRDYEVLGKGNIVIATKDPSNNPEVANEAEAAGVQKVKFNVIKNEDFQAKSGYFGLTIAHGNEKEVIPFIDSTGDLEYKLTSFINKLTTTDKKKVVFLEGHGEKSLDSDYLLLGTELEKQFDTQKFTFRDEQPNESPAPNATPAPLAPLPEGTGVIVVAGPRNEIPQDEQMAIGDFLQAGGSALFLIDSLDVQQQMQSVSPLSKVKLSMLDDYGISIPAKLLYDLRSNQLVQMSSGGPMQFISPYPFWLKALPTENAQVISSIGVPIMFPWASPVEIEMSKLEAKGLIAKPIFTTSTFAGTQEKVFSISPQEEINLEPQGAFPIAVAIQAANADTQNPPRFIVVGDSDFLADENTQHSAENLAFGTGVISWLAQENSLAGIQVKSRTAADLVLQSENQKMMIKYGNMAIVIVLPLLFGLVRLVRRRRLRGFTFSTGI